uniref:K Homology domain-containing protein n=1 Tax=Florenciella parvula TaxID=236787 RepID=A0A7S2FAD3_9STRA
MADGSVMSKQVLRGLTESTGCSHMSLDWDAKCVHINGSPDDVVTAVAEVTRIHEAWASRRKVVSLPGEWMIPVIIGKAGAKIKALRKNHGGVKVEIDDNLMAVVIEAKEGANASASAAEVQALVDAAVAARPEQVEVPIPPDTNAIPTLIGRQGAGIKKIEQSTGARIDILKHRDVIVIKGNTSAIASAKKLVDEVFSRATVNGGGGGGGGGGADVGGGGGGAPGGGGGGGGLAASGPPACGAVAGSLAEGIEPKSSIGGRASIMS